MSSDNLAPPPPVAGEGQSPSPTRRVRAKKSANYRAVRWPLHHPYQNITVPSVGSAVLEEDSWLQAQLDAKTIVKV